MVKPTDANLRSRAATQPLTCWLIDAATKETTLSYGEAKRRLENQCGFDSIGRATRLGLVAGAMQNNILGMDQTAPLLNVLLVRQDTGEPGDGARGYLARRFHDKRWLRNKGAREDYPDRWTNIVARATREVYNYRRWKRLYKDIYGSNFEFSPLEIEGTERDGLRRGRNGEGENHKRLRLWVKDNPGLVKKRLHNFKTKTEVELLSGDRVDVICRAKEKIVAIEVKSRDSDSADLRRGIYQCVKYRAVLSAEHIDSAVHVSALLVSESQLPTSCRDLATRLKVEHRVVRLP